MKKWTRAHRREAMRCLLRREDEWLDTTAHDAEDVQELVFVLSTAQAASEESFLYYLLNVIGMSKSSARRTVRRVRGIAEGRLVREVKWEVRSPGGAHMAEFDNHMDAKRYCKPPLKVVRVARVRRAR